MRAAAAASMEATDDANPASATVVDGVKVRVGLVGDGAGLGAAGCESGGSDVEVAEQPATASTASTAARSRDRRRREDITLHL